MCRQTDVTVWIGKDGLSDELLKQIANQLKARKLVKLKMQKSALSETGTAQMAERVASSTGATLIEVLGRTFSLYKAKENEVSRSAFRD